MQLASSLMIEVNGPACRRARRRSRGLRAFAALLALGWLILFVPQSWADEGKVHGTAQYEKIPYGDGGLQLDTPKNTPIVGARVDLVSGTNLVAQAFTDTNGAYEIPWKLDKGTMVFVRIVAQSNHVVVINNAGNYHVNSLAAFPVSQGDVVQNILVKDGKDGDGGAGAFNILAAIRRADAFLEKANPGSTAKIPQITVSWTSGFNGVNDQTHFDPRDNSAFIHGDRRVDSDEFDDCVLTHEYGHFVMHVFSRDDSPGGTHSPGMDLDPRLAWSEGWGNFFSCAVLDSSKYIDTGRDRVGRETVIYRFDFETPRKKGADYSDEDVDGWTMWHIYRNGSTPAGDGPHLGIGFKEMWDVITGPLKERRDVTLIDFCDLLVANDPKLAKGVTDVLAARKINYYAGKNPSVANPYQIPLLFGKDYEGAVNSMDVTTFLVPLNYNNFESTVVYNFTLTEKSTVKLQVAITGSENPQHSDLCLFLEDKDGLAGLSVFSIGVGGSGSFVKELDPGTYYVRVASSYLTKNTARYRLKGTIKGGPK